MRRFEHWIVGSCLLVGLLLSGCKKDPGKSPQTEPFTESGSLEQPSPKAVAEQTPAPSFDPIITLDQPADRLPLEIAFQYPQPVSTQLGKPLEDPNTRVNITPRVPGKLVWETEQRLVFRPEGTGFAYNTGYTIELLSVDTRFGIKTPSPNEPWRHVMKTPEFRLERLELDQAKVSSRELVFVATFTGPVRIESLSKRVGAWFGSVTCALSADKLTANQFRLRGRCPQLRPEGELSVHIDPGIEALGRPDKTTQAYKKSFSLNVPGYLNIAHIQLKEAQNGFQIDVFCDDEQTKNKRGYYDYYTERCPLEIDTLSDFVRIDKVEKLSFSKIRNGFRIHGDIRYGQNNLQIQSGLTSTNGSLLSKTYERTLNVARRSPSVRFVSQGRYLPRSVLDQLAIRHINVDQVTLEIRKIYRQNLVYWLTAPTDRPDDRVSDVVATHTFSLPNQPDQETVSMLQIKKALGDIENGAYQLSLTGARQNDEVRLMLTDLTLIAKRYGTGGQDLAVWVLDSKSLQPVSGARVELVAQSNRVIHSKSTGDQGGMTFSGAVDPVTGKPPFALFVHKDDDLSFMEFADLEISLGDENVQGSAYRTDVPYQAALYADRGVYRPGETAHLVALLRDDHHLGVEDLPLVGKLIDPRSKIASTLRARTNTAGMAAFDIDLQSFASTGNWTFTLEAGGKAIQTLRFNVEEFMPERMQVSIRPSQPEFRLTQPVKVQISARYLFGSSANGEKTELVCSLLPAAFSPPRVKGYVFGLWSEEPSQPLLLGSATGNLDEKGQLVMSCPSPATTTHSRGPSKVQARVSVFESGSGRTTSQTVDVPVHPEKTYLGLKTGAQKAETGASIHIEGIATDWQGNPEPDIQEVAVEIIKLERDYNYEYIDGSYRYRSYTRRVRESGRRVKVQAGKFQVDFTPSGYCRGYLVKASFGNSASELFIESGGYSYWRPHASGSDNTPRPSGPVTLIMEAENSINPGEKSSVTIKPPFPGKLLFTVETDTIVESRWLDIGMQDTQVSFRINEFAPNVYLSGLLIKDPHRESNRAFLPGRAFGLQVVRIKPSPYSLSLTLQAPEEIRPNSKLTVDLDAQGTQGPAFVTVAAVDEGILQLTGFRSPDILGLLFDQRALGVATFDTAGWMLKLPPADNSLSPGGSAEGSRAGRIAPVKPVALWSGLVKMSQGKARVELPVPQYRGQLRIMAVAADKHRAASAATRTTVRDPLVLLTTLPRFLLSGDRFVVPVSATNLTGRKGTFTITPETGPGIQLENPDPKSVLLDDQASGTVTFVATSTESFGRARFAVKATGNRTSSADEVVIPFLPNAPVTRETHVVSLSEGKNEIHGMLAGWNPQTEKTEIWVTTNRYGKQLMHLKHLIRYPYGCIEQTTSTTRPLLHIANLLSNLAPDLFKDAGIEEKFMHGVNRLLSMQTTEGGFSYWPGETHPTYWGTAYVTHLLLEGKEKGYPIPQDRIKDALDFMQRVLTNQTKDTDHKYGYSVESSEPYMQFVLARAGRGQKGRLRKLLSDDPKKWGELSEENTFLLKAALYLTGDRSHESTLKTIGKPPVENRRQNGWTFWSALRSHGMRLTILEDLFPQSSQAEPLAALIADQLGSTQNSWSFTTQELSWCAGGLGKRSSRGPTSWSKTMLFADGKAIEPRVDQTKPNDLDRTWSVSSASASDSLWVEMSDLSGQAYAIVDIEGLKPGVAYQFADHTLKVRRSYHDLEGRSIDTNDIRLGALINVKITLANTSNQRVRNVALVDRFGAGLEVENPRLNRGSVVDWSKGKAWEISYFNLRDDRVEYFGHLQPRQTVEVIYTLRAVTAGLFASPPIKAEAMYDPNIWSQHAGERIRILDPWNAI